MSTPIQRPKVAKKQMRVDQTEVRPKQRVTQESVIYQNEPQPSQTKSSLKQWVGLTLFAILLVLAYKFWPALPEMNGYHVVVFSLALSFTWVEKLKWGVIKPFNCVPCLTGWFAVIIAFAFHTPFWYFYLFVGLLVGSLFSAVKSRWL